MTETGKREYSKEPTRKKGGKRPRDRQEDTLLQKLRRELLLAGPRAAIVEVVRRIGELFGDVEVVQEEDQEDNKENSAVKEDGPAGN